MLYVAVAIFDGGMDSLYFERPKPYGFDSARCRLPSYEWIMRDGFTDEEMMFFESFLQNNAHTIFKYAEQGGLALPKLFKIGRYIVFFWSNENDEPIHVHIGIVNPSPSATKIWLTKGGGCIIANNSSKIPKHEPNELFGNNSR